MKIVKLKRNNLRLLTTQAVNAIENGGLVVLPSDTAYGLAVRADIDQAVNKVFDFKGRYFGKGISVFLKNVGEIDRFVEVDPAQVRLIDTLLPGPFTLVLPSRHLLSRKLEAPDGTLGVRVIDSPLINGILDKTSFPITATSANLTGKGPHYSVKALLNTLSGRKKAMLDLVVDAGLLPPRQTSTVIKLAGDRIDVLREGSLNLELLGKWRSQGEKKTRQTAQAIFEKYFADDLIDSSVVLILKGDLGAGKTVFAKGIGEIFGLELTSPTFVLMEEYQLKGKNNLKSLYHLDLYRIESKEEIHELELPQFLKPGNLVLIEWGEKLAVFEKLKSSRTSFYLLNLQITGENERRLILYRF